MEQFSKELLQTKDFELVIERLPAMTYFCIEAPIPAVSSNAARYPTPFTPVKYPGDQLVYDQFTCRFRVNADLSNYRAILNWMEEYGTPDNFDQYNTPGVSEKQQARAKMSAASLFVFTNKYNPHLEFRFEDMFPVNLGSLQIISAQAGVTYLTCDVTFDYTKFTLAEPLT